jgi:hypothetical protein
MVTIRPMRAETSSLSMACTVRFSVSANRRRSSCFQANRPARYAGKLKQFTLFQWDVRVQDVHASTAEGAGMAWGASFRSGVSKDLRAS